jgi:hypothetical protein
MPIDMTLNRKLEPMVGWSKDAHKVGFVKVHYSFHPYFGETLRVIRVDRGQVHVKVPDGESVRALPLWMTEKEVCRQIKISLYPYCSCRALRSLKELLEHATEKL